jgi:hypothetical protein
MFAKVFDAVSMSNFFHSFKFSIHVAVKNKYNHRKKAAIKSNNHRKAINMR